EPALCLIPRRPAANLHEAPPAVQLLALERERESAFLHAGARVVDRLPGPVVPHDDAAPAVLAFRNHAFEVRVLDGMVLGLHREALLARIEARALRHRPALERPVELETEVVMQTRRGGL